MENTRVIARSLATELTMIEISAVGGGWTVTDSKSLINTTENTVCDMGQTCNIDDVESGMDA